MCVRFESGFRRYGVYQWKKGKKLLSKVGAVGMAKRDSFSSPSSSRPREWRLSMVLKDDNETAVVFSIYSINDVVLFPFFFLFIFFSFFLFSFPTRFIYFPFVYSDYFSIIIFQLYIQLHRLPIRAAFADGSATSSGRFSSYSFSSVCIYTLLFSRQKRESLVTYTVHKSRGSFLPLLPNSSAPISFLAFFPSSLLSIFLVSSLCSLFSVYIHTDETTSKSPHSP